MITPELTESMDKSMQQKRKDEDNTIKVDKRPRYDIRNYLGLERINVDGETSGMDRSEYEQKSLQKKLLMGQ